MTSDQASGAAVPRRGDRRLLPSLVVLVVILIPLLLPSALPGAAQAAWILLPVGVVLLATLALLDPGRIDRRNGAIRAVSLVLIVLLVLTCAWATARLVVELVRGAPDLNDPVTLLVAGGLVWLDVNLTFALLYWELDSGGPAERLLDPRPYPDLAFPQHMNPAVAPPDWMPRFGDHLYLGLTNALAFSPTDVMPLAHWAKFSMALQSLLSVTILSLIIANAVNLLG